LLGLGEGNEGFCPCRQITNPDAQQMLQITEKELSEVTDALL